MGWKKRTSRPEALIILTACQLPQMVDHASDFDASCLCLLQAGHQVSPGGVVRPFVNLEVDRQLGSSDQSPEAAQDLSP